MDYLGYIPYLKWNAAKNGNPFVNGNTPVISKSIANTETGLRYGNLIKAYTVFAYLILLHCNSYSIISSEKVYELQKVL